jgi:hypothetical protein
LFLTLHAITSTVFQTLCFVDRASRYIRVLKTNLMHYLSSVYLVNQSLHVSGHMCISSIPTWPTDSQLKKHNTYQLLYMYSIPLDDRLQICPKHVGVDRWNTLKINSASSWFSLHKSSKCNQD